MPANLVPAQLGRFQTRINRIVDIDSSRMVTVEVGGGRTEQKRIWTGTMYQADARTADGRYDWDDSGNFVNQRGVANPNDLALMISAAPIPAVEVITIKDPEPAEQAGGDADRAAAE